MVHSKQSSKMASALRLGKAEIGVGPNGGGAHSRASRIKVRGQVMLRLVLGLMLPRGGQALGRDRGQVGVGTARVINGPDGQVPLCNRSNMNSMDMTCRENQDTVGVQ